MHEGTREETFAHLAAEFINRESNRESLITVTRVMSSTDSKRADVYITVLPDTRVPEALDFLKRKRSEFREFVKTHTRGRSVPTFDFVFDVGEKNRQEIEALSQH
ncbi:MAG: ribosome-binding factor A [Patescibacteria group bacterium]